MVFPINIIRILQTYLLYDTFRPIYSKIYSCVDYCFCCTFHVPYYKSPRWDSKKNCLVIFCFDFSYYREYSLLCEFFNKPKKVESKVSLDKHHDRWKHNPKRLCFLFTSVYNFWFQKALFICNFKNFYFKKEHQQIQLFY